MKVFLDSNVFLYAFLDQDSAKKGVAARCLADAVRTSNGFISLQVVKEFCNVMLKRSTKSADEVAGVLGLFNRFNMINGSVPLVQQALAIKSRYDIQFYDSLMIAAAVAGGCDTIFTEDLNNGQLYCGVRAVNPFAA